jgi:two-component system phosphate regulon sensor histidine kinase PhoR
MVILDAANRIEWANVRAQAHLGLDLAQDVGHPLLNFVRQPEVVRYFEAGEFNDSVVIDSLREAETTLSIQVVPFGVDGRLVISRNITQIEAVARMRRDFIANVSHELKTPLTVIAGFLETLQDLELEPRQRTRYLQLMTEQANSMQRLVNDLLTLSALESEQGTRADASFAILPLLLEVSADANALSGGRHKIALDVADPAIVTGNRDELASAFGNLVSNAVRYTPDGGTITLGWRVDEEGRGAFEVADTGIGIAPEHIPRLTERFYRVDRSRSRETGGTGLGLAIVKHVLLRHQAELDVTSELGLGSTFTVLLPAQRVAPAAATGSQAPAPVSSTTSS